MNVRKKKQTYQLKIRTGHYLLRGSVQIGYGSYIFMQALRESMSKWLGLLKSVHFFPICTSPPPPHLNK